MNLRVTTSWPTSRGRRKDQNTSGQQGNKFNNSYRDISVIVAENNSVVKPKYQQYASLNKMFRNFSKVLIVHISFTAVEKHWRRHPERHQEELNLHFVTFCVTRLTKKENQNCSLQMNSLTLPKKICQIFQNLTCSYS